MNRILFFVFISTLFHPAMHQGAKPVNKCHDANGDAEGGANLLSRDVHTYECHLVPSALHTHVYIHHTYHILYIYAMNIWHTHIQCINNHKYNTNIQYRNATHIYTMHLFNNIYNEYMQYILNVTSYLPPHHPTTLQCQEGWNLYTFIIIYTYSINDYHILSCICWCESAWESKFTVGLLGECHSFFIGHGLERLKRRHFFRVRRWRDSAMLLPPTYPSLTSPTKEPSDLRSSNSDSASPRMPEAGSIWLEPELRLESGRHRDQRAMLTMPSY